MKNEAKLVFRAWMHYFEVLNFRKRFCYECIQSTPLDPNKSLGCFEAFCKPSARKTTWKLCFVAKCTISGNRTFEKVSLQKHRIYSIRLKMMFESVSMHFAKLHNEKWWKLMFRAWMHHLDVPKLWKKFQCERIQSILLDWKWCLGVFRSTSQTFGMKNDAKLVFRAWMHYFEVLKLWKWFCNEINYPTPVDPKRCLRVFRSISQTFSTSNKAKLVFQA